MECLFYIIFSLHLCKILASPEASERLSGVFYDHIDDDHRLTDNDSDHFLQVLFHAYQNGDISALLLELCGRSMFDLLREAYLIPKKFHGKAGSSMNTLAEALGITCTADIGLMSIEGSDTVLDKLRIS